MQVLAPLSSASSHREAMPYPDAHAPLVGAVNLGKLAGCAFEWTGRWLRELA